MGDTTLVWFFAGRLTMVAPDGRAPLLFHRLNSRNWHLSKCGKGAQCSDLVAMRRDTADRFAMPCLGCFPEERP